MDFLLIDYIVYGLQLLMDFQFMDFQFIDYIIYGLQMFMDFQFMEFKLMGYMLMDLTEWDWEEDISREVVFKCHCGQDCCTL